jgi:hypothetical protein
MKITQGIVQEARPIRVSRGRYGADVSSGLEHRPKALMRAFYVCGDPQKSGGCQIIVTTKRELLYEEKSGLSVVLDRCRRIYMN